MTPPTMTDAIWWLWNLAMYLLVLVGSLAIIAACLFLFVLAIGWTLTGISDAIHWWRNQP